LAATDNVLHNQILKAALKTLLRVRELDKGLKEQVAGLSKGFPSVSDIFLESRHFGMVRLNRNNYFYDFLLRVCKIIHESVLVDEKTGVANFMDFIRDEGQMATVFEEFVRNFYRKEQSSFKVGREYIKWAIMEPGAHDAYLPVMKTDTCLTAKLGSRKIVIETKYYKDILTTNLYSKDKIKSENLYQLYAYLKNLEFEVGVNFNCEGILLYAAVDQDLDCHFSLPGHNLRVKTLNLNQDWQGIHKELLSMVGIFC